MLAHAQAQAGYAMAPQGYQPNGVPLGAHDMAQDPPLFCALHAILLRACFKLPRSHEVPVGMHNSRV